MMMKELRRWEMEAARFLVSSVVNLFHLSDMRTTLLCTHRMMLSFMPHPHRSKHRMSTMKHWAHAISVMAVRLLTEPRLMVLQFLSQLLLSNVGCHLGLMLKQMPPVEWSSLAMLHRWLT